MATLVEWDGGTLPTITGTNPTVTDATMVFPAGSAANYAAWTISADQFTLRWYVTLPSAWAASSWSMAYALAGGNINARVNLAGSGTPGQLRFLRAGNTQIANTAANALVLSTTYRVEIQVDRVAQTYRAAVFPLLSDTPLYDTGLLTSIDTGAATFTALQLGRLTALTTGELAIGRVKAVDSVGSWIGRHPSDTGGGGDPGTTLVEWDGGTLPTITGATPSLDGDNYMVFPAGSTSHYASFTAGADAYTARFYCKLPSAWAAASVSLFTANNAAGNVDRVNLAGSGSPGQLRFVAAGNTQIANTPANTINLSQHLRIEIQVDRVAQTYRAAVFPIGSSSPAYDTGLLSSIDSGAAAFTAFLAGRITNGVALGDTAIGRIKIIDGVGTWIGAHDDDPPLIPEIYGIWDGTTILAVEMLGVWDGTSIDPTEIVQA